MDTKQLDKLNNLVLEAARAYHNEAMDLASNQFTIDASIEPFVDTIAAQHEQEVATLRAKVALVGEVLQRYRKKCDKALWIDPVREASGFTECLCDECKRARRALSTEPQVLWSGEAELNDDYDLNLPDAAWKAIKSHVSVETQVPITILDPS